MSPRFDPAKPLESTPPFVRWTLALGCPLREQGDYADPEQTERLLRGVRCYSDGAEALKALSAQPVDIAVLDIKMPRMDGMELLGQLRRQSAIPVIFLTSKDDEVDELLGLRMGADDYIKKPFSQRLLIERTRALIRRGELARERDDAQSEPVAVRGHLVLDPARHLCSWKGEPVELTVP